MPDERRIDEILIFAKYAGTCTDCGYRIAVNASIWFNTHTRKARHKNCPEISYDGSEQRNTFDTWIKAFQDMEGKK